MPSRQSLPQPISAEEGFTLLEGLVAIALLAGTMAAIFTLVGGILSSANTVGRSNQTAQVTLNALEVMTTVNPMLQGREKSISEYTRSAGRARQRPPSATASDIPWHQPLSTCSLRDRRSRRRPARNAAGGVRASPGRLSPRSRSDAAAPGEPAWYRSAQPLIATGFQITVAITRWQSA